MNREAQIIDVVCRTNLDGYEREEWPTRLPTRPLRGDLIQAKSGKRLGVVSVCWLFDGTLEVELHTPFSGGRSP